MADTIKISQMDNAAPLTGAEFVPIVQSGANKKAIASNIALAGNGLRKTANTLSLMSQDNGQILIGTGLASEPTAALVSAGTNIVVLSGAGSIQISANNAASFFTLEITSTTQTMSSYRGYIANNASLVTFTLPSSPTTGDFIYVYGKGSGGWRIAQNAGQSIICGTGTTTVGTGGSLSSTNSTDAVLLVCSTVLTTFTAYPISGTLTGV